MDLLNLKSIEDITFPLFVIGRIEVYPRLTGELGDAERKPIINNDGVNETFERLTAMAVFTSFNSLINAYASEIALNEGVIEAFKSKAESLGVKNPDMSEFNSQLDYIRENEVKAENAFKEYFKYKISKNKI